MFLLYLFQQSKLVFPILKLNVAKSNLYHYFNKNFRGKPMCIHYTYEWACTHAYTHTHTHTHTQYKDMSSQMWSITESMLCNLEESVWAHKSGLNTIATKSLKLAESDSNFCLIEPLGLNNCFEIHTSACSSHTGEARNPSVRTEQTTSPMHILPPSQHL